MREKIIYVQSFLHMRVMCVELAGAAVVCSAMLLLVDLEATAHALLIA